MMHLEVHISSGNQQMLLAPSPFQTPLSYSVVIRCSCAFQPDHVETHPLHQTFPSRSCAGIIRSELYKIANTTTPYGVTVQTIVDVSSRGLAVCVVSL
jgi:hypothetical protein